jgi:hypothetical protein
MTNNSSSLVPKIIIGFIIALAAEFGTPKSDTKFIVPIIIMIVIIMVIAPGALLLRRSDKN